MKRRTRTPAPAPKIPLTKTLAIRMPASVYDRIEADALAAGMLTSEYARFKLMNSEEMNQYRAELEKELTHKLNLFVSL